MDPLVKKEIRMLLPAWIAAMLLALVQGVTRPYDFYVASLLFLGLTLMALTSFGREASLNTFSSLLAQPVARLRLWQVKLSVLAAGFVTVFLAWLAAFGLAWANSQVDVTSAADSYNLFITVCLIATATFTGGLWTALLLRQVAGAFWLTLLVPAMLSGFSGIFLANSDSSSLVIAVLSVVIGAYSIGGFFFARRLFFRAQDIGWSGGVLAMPEWRWRSVRAGDDTSTRSRKPVFALIKKELFLHQSTLVGALVLLIVHAVLIVIRTVHTFDKNSPGETAASLFTVLFWICWVALAPVTGAEAVAEERRLGVMDGQLCQPYSRRMQFAVKAILTLLLAVFLGGCMPLFLELTGAHFGRAGSLFTDPAEGGLAVGILALAAWLGLIGFFASTLAKSFLQAVGFSVGTFIACTLLVPVFTGGRMLFLDSIPGPHILPLLLAVPTIIVTLLVLAYLNFSRYRDDWGLWRRNAGGLAGAIIFIFAGSNAIYHRAWEVFEPAEPAHGSARLTRFDPADLRNESFNNLLVRLPDGRVWFDFVNNRGPWSMVLNPHFIWELLNSLPHSAGPQQYIAGTNWLDASARHVDEMVPSYKEDHGSVRIVGYADTIGIQRDGTLWVSGVASPNHWEAGKLIQVGNDTNWCQFIRSYSLTQVILRKSDGTLWYWGTNQFDFGTWPDGWPGLRSFSPVQIGSDRDWTGIFWLDGYLGKKSDGSLWRIGIDRKGGWPEAHRLAPRDPTYPLTTGTFASGAFHSWTAYVRPDGSLWANGRLPDQVSHGQLQLAWANQQCGKDTDWLTVANTWSRMVAIKKDGTLWQWNWGDNSPAHPFVINLNSQPARLGIHNDWIALAVVEEGVVTLAADGSLWLWPDRDSYRYWESIIQLPKQPISLGNVFTPAR